MWRMAGVARLAFDLERRVMNAEFFLQGCGECASYGVRLGVAQNDMRCKHGLARPECPDVQVVNRSDAWLRQHHPTNGL